MIYKIAWAVTLLAFGLIELGVHNALLPTVAGIALIVAGIAFALDK